MFLALISHSEYTPWGRKPLFSTPHIIGDSALSLSDNFDMDDFNDRQNDELSGDTMDMNMNELGK